jgi:hypothetical protein
MSVRRDENNHGHRHTHLVMTMLSDLPVALSAAETFMMPLAVVTRHG